MSEKFPTKPDAAALERQLREYQEQMAVGQELQRQDREDPVRGPIVRMVRMVVLEASKTVMEKDSAYAELSAFWNAFLEHFGSDEARRYRLFHIIIGSTPPSTADLFDAEGEWSIALKMQEFTEKYGFGQVDAEAA